MISFRRENDEVLYPNDDKIEFSVSDIATLKDIADRNFRKRVRLCCHRSRNDLVHEMIIVHAKECYVRPHSHPERDESIYILEGEADFLIFDETGEISQIVELGDITSGKTLYKKIPRNTLHSLIFHTPHLVFKEVTSGPFNPDATYHPNWSPPEQAKPEVIKNYLDAVKSKSKEKQMSP